MWLKAIGAIVGLIAVISLLLILYLFGIFTHVHTDRDELPATSTVATSAPVETEEVVINPLATPIPTTTPTVAPTQTPTQEPTTTPTEAPTATPTPEPQARISWKIVSAESGQPIKQARVWLAFNQYEPAILLWSDEAGNITYDFDQVPNLGDNGRGYAVFQETGLEKTELWFELDPSTHNLVLVKSNGEAVNGSIQLFSFDQAVSADLAYWNDSQVWPECDAAECATEIALTSGSFSPGEAVTCQAEVLDALTTTQRFRAANGLTVLESTDEFPNIVDSMWSDREPGLPGWKCGSSQRTETVFVAGGCGNIAIAKPH